MRSALLTSAIVATFAATSAHAQLVGYGVNSDGFLFRFDPDNPAVITTIGSTGITTRGIDFRPGTQSLYGLSVGPNTAQLYTIDINTAAATPVGSGFPVSGANYDLGNNNRIGFDFNPRTLQADTSMRIRVITDNSASNLRLNSNTGALAATDTPLAFPVGDPNANNAPFANASAYINSAAGTLPSAGTTTLYNIDPRRDVLLTQNPPNSGTLNTVGSFFASVDLDPDVAFDIVSSNPADDSLADERAILIGRGQLPARGTLTPYRLWDINLVTGAVSSPRTVTGTDFTGGMALLIVPEPATLFAISATGLLLLRRARPNR
jgi:hypothetical protein